MRKGSKHTEEAKIKMSIGMKGRIAWNKGKRLPERSGENHFAWKGDAVSYGALHDWVKKEKGDPQKCKSCKKVGKITYTKNGRRRWTITWANISGEYKRNISDWVGLCHQCHSDYDIAFNGKYGLNPIIKV